MVFNVDLQSTSTIARNLQEHILWVCRAL
ncbi:hypothetical protein HU200_050750 [Digitaria exilis]|uniref:Uncharacterized protein n=1 Tax=Digitaria exilis TaxID=1010633 RepID=A0A835ASY6_9POAL|nr:hypothetical protein HU200_050750 [Digitaria exilis]